TGLAGWWTDTVEVAPGVGGMVKPSFAAAPLPFDLRIDESTATRVVWRAQSFPPHWVGTEVRWELSDAPANAGTRVLFMHAGFAADDAEMPSAAFTWGQCLGRLQKYTESGTPQPYFVR
ncbi:MAG TPA: SRPBCC domain-containing protein, partial [Chloroflexota bacterium]|nr:SRPBCC domain-containing protein [Chloroflexota bacterium]